MTAIVLVLAVGLLQQDWITYEPEGKGFRVEMPGRPNKTSSRTQATAAGRAEVSLAQLKMPDVTYTVQVVENASKVDPKSLDDGIRRFAAGLKVELGAITPITIGTNSGREFEISQGSGAARQRSKMRWVASGNSLLIISATGAPGGGLVADADRFLGSLEIGGARTPVAIRSRAEMPGGGRAPAPATSATTKAKAKAKAEVEAAPAVAEPPNAATEAPAKKVLSRITISKIPRTAKPYPEDEIQDLPRPFEREREAFRDLGPVGSVLVGVRVSFVDKFGGPKIGSVQPVYRSGKTYYAGRTYGEVTGPVATVVAGPGYAVGGIVARAGLMVDGFGMVFMMVDGDHLNPEDTYNSPWMGDRKGGSVKEVTSPGGLVVGLPGRSRDVVFALGLTTLR
jgi:hypothetical protein